MDIDQKYDTIAIPELEKRLNRQPTDSEIINSDKDSDLVTETLWQLIKDLEARVKILEDSQNVV